MRASPPIHLLSVQEMSCLFEHALHMTQDCRVGITEGGDIVAWLISAERYSDLVAQCNLLHGQLTLLRGGLNETPG